MINTHTVFDADWYLARNPDVAEAVAGGLVSAIEHFELFGKTEGRAPGPLFDPEYYLSANPDVATAVEQGLMSATEHFLQFGVSENRSPLPIFDSAFYLARNPDIAVAVREGIMTPTEHFLLHGHGEPRLIDPFIDLGAYLRANTDVAEQYADSGLSPLTHLLTHGLKEGRELGNGIDLAVFANDPVFQNAVDSGDSTGAIARVQEIAPFLPTFVPPAGWTVPADTPIPLDFIPPAGLKLVVPASVEIPPGLELPPYFEVLESADPVEPAEPEVPVEPVDPTAPVTPGTPTKPDVPEPEKPEKPTFWVSKSDDDKKYSFHGTATGEIRIVVEGDTISFTRGDITASSDINLDEWTLGRDVITLASDQTLVLDSQQAAYLSLATLGKKAVAFDGTGTILIEANELDFASIASLASGISIEPTLYNAATGGFTSAGGGDTMPMPANLLSISPTLSLKFSGEDAVNVGENVLLMIHAHHADSLSITGEGSAVVFGPSLLELLETAGLSASDLPFAGLGDAPGLERVDLTVSTSGLNVITATSGDDEIDVGEGAMSLVYAGQGQDTINLAEYGDSVVLIMAGEPDHEILSDSHFEQMDVISGFTVGQHMVVAGHPTSAQPVASMDATVVTVNEIKFSITDGMAYAAQKVKLEDLLEALSAYQADAREALAFEHEGSTYLFYGDGNSALTEYDMVVQLVGVTGVNDITDLMAVVHEEAFATS